MINQQLRFCKVFCCSSLRAWFWRRWAALKGMHGAVCWSTAPPSTGLLVPGSGDQGSMVPARPSAWNVPCQGDTWLIDCLPHKDRLEEEQEWEGEKVTDEKVMPTQHHLCGQWPLLPAWPSSIQKASQNGLGESASGSAHLPSAEPTAVTEERHRSGRKDSQLALDVGRCQPRWLRPCGSLSLRFQHTVETHQRPPEAPLVLLC